MAQSMFNIGGIASGLDTESIISQLMSIERQPVTNLQNKQARLKAVDDAWGQINTKLSSLRDAIDGLDRANDFTNLWSTTSSNTSAVNASVSGTPSPGSVSFTVDKLASAQQMTSTTQFASADALVGGGSTFTVSTSGGTQLGSVALDATTTLTDLASQVDAMDGVRAQVVKAGTGDYRLVLSAESTGSDGAFTISSGNAAFDVTDPSDPATDWITTPAVDAQVTMGGLAIKRSSNTITDLIDGVTLDLNAESTTPVTVSTTRDVDGVVKKVKALVDAANGVIGKVADLTSYDADTKKAGTLNGDSTARQIARQLRDAITTQFSSLGSTYDYAGSVGIHLERDGTVSLDESALRDALDDDFDAVTDLFTRTGSSANANLSYVYATDTTVQGIYSVAVTKAADAARATSTGYTAPAAGTTTDFTIVAGGTNVNVSITDAETTAADAAAKIQGALDAQGVTTIQAGVDASGNLTLAETRYGSVYSFTVTDTSATPTNDFGLAGTYTGTDVEATIGGNAATGSGQYLTGTAGDTEGLQVKADATAGTFTADFDYSAGLGGTFSRLVSTMEGSTGSIQRQRDSAKSQIDGYQDQIDSYDVRLQQRELTLRKQFTAMETALQTLQSQGNWMAQQISGLSANSAK